MSKREAIEARRLLAETDIELSDPSLSPDQRQKLLALRPGLAGVTMNVWLPTDWVRRGLMAIIALVGAQGVFVGPAWLAWILVALPLFSPRLMGEFAYGMGRASRSNGGQD